jgi:hypothetical protein
MKKNTWLVGIGMAMALSVALVGCGGGSPGGAVKDYYNAMNSGKYADAITYLGPAMAEMAKFDGGKMMSDEMTHNGTMTKVEILETNVRGEGAEIKARIHFKDSSVNDTNISLVKQDGDWKIIGAY